MKLFVFDHCPFCIKAMMVAGLKKTDIELVYLQNHDIDARIEKVGVNLVPILQKPDGSYMAESLDIAAYLDDADGRPGLGEATETEKIDAWSETTRPYGSLLLFPRWLKIDLPEFQCQEAKNWFHAKKSAMIDVSFDQAFDNSAEYIEKLNTVLNQLDWLTLPSERDNKLTYDDVNLFPTLRNYTVIKGLVFPSRLRQYVDEVSGLTGITLYDDVAV